MPVNPDGSINVVVKQVKDAQNVVIVGWRNSEGDYKQLYNLEGLPVRITNQP